MKTYQPGNWIATEELYNRIVRWPHSQIWFDSKENQWNFWDSDLSSIEAADHIDDHNYDLYDVRLFHHIQRVIIQH